MKQPRIIEVVPAIIPESLEDLRSELSLVKGIVRKVQIDVLDGVYVPEISWPYNNKTELEKITSEEEGLPFWADFDFEIDMMVSSPLEKAEGWILSGAESLIIHYESLADKEEFRKIKEICQKRDVLTALAFRPRTTLGDVEDLINDADFVQLMGNDKIGRHGVSLDESVYTTASVLREKYPDMTIAVDIGVNFETAERLLESGVDKLVSGSAIFEGDIVENIKMFGDIIERR